MMRFINNGVVINWPHILPLSHQCVHLKLIYQYKSPLLQFQGSQVSYFAMRPFLIDYLPLETTI